MKAQIVKRLEDEMQGLEYELRTQLPKEILRARELGDLRENAEYHAAKERQKFVEARISMLQQRIAAILRINLDKLPRDKANFGSTVHLRDDKGVVVVYQLVLPEDADVEQGLISTTSPIGKAIVNKEEGDTVVARTPNGDRTFEVLKVITIHDE